MKTRFSENWLGTSRNHALLRDRPLRARPD